MKDKNVLKDLLIILTIIIITIMFFASIIFSSNYKITWDTFDQQYPWLNSTASQISSGVFPLWSESFFSGYPTFQDPQVGTFYPFNIFLSLFCDKDTGFLNYIYIELSIVLHYILMGVFTYILCRTLKIGRVSSLFSAILFEFCGYIACHPQHYSSIMSLTWLPLCLSFLLKIYDKNTKKDCIGFIISFALSVLGGHIQTTLYSGIFLLLITIILTIKKYKLKENKKDAYKFLGKVCILFISAGLISGIQLIPTLELMSNSSRADMTYEEFSTNSNNPVDLITAIIPYFLDINNSWFNKEPTETHYYLSIIFFIVMILYLCSDKQDEEKKYLFDSKIWIISAIIFFILSLGENTFINRVMYVIPILNKLRRSVNFLYIVSLLLAIIAGYAVDLLLNNKDKINYIKSKRYIKILDIIFLIFIVISYIALFVIKEGKNFNLINNILNGLWVSTIFINIIFYMVNIYLNGKLSKSIMSIFLICILIVDLFTFNSNITPNSSRQNANLDLSYDYVSYNGEVNKILRQANDDNARVAICDVDAFNTGGVIQVSDIWGYNPLTLVDYEKYAENFNLKLCHKPTTDTDFSSVYVDMLSLKYILATNKFVNENETINLDKYKTIYEKGNFVILENKEYLPAFYTVKNVENLDSYDDVYEKISDKSYNPKDICYVFEGENKKYEIGNTDIKVISKTNSKIVLDVNSDYEAFVATSKMMYSGWKVKVNDNKELKKINGIFIGFEVPKGNSTVEIYYQPITLYIGIVSCVFGVVILLGILLYKKNKRS